MKTLVITLFVISLVIWYVYLTVQKIKHARELGRRLSKRNAYYALITRLFVKDLPK